MTFVPKSRSLLLDRDGVINLDLGYIHRPEDMVFVEGIFDLCCYAYNLNYQVVVITNQSGIGRGYYSEADFQLLTGWMKDIFQEHGCPLSQVYFCPYHPTKGVGVYRRESTWRKPAPGMILAAAQDLGLDLVNSVLVGDKPWDIEAGQAAGVGCNLLYVGENPEFNWGMPTATVSHLSQVKFYLQ